MAGKKKKFSKNSVKYNVELDICAIIIFLVLSLGICITVFYLGLIVGKSTRVPTPANPPSQLRAAVSEGKSVPKDLTVFDMEKREEEKLSSLKNEFNQQVKKSDPLMKKTTVKPPKKIHSEAFKKQPVAKKTVVKQSAAVNKNDPLYTVQVYATSRQNYANNLMSTLLKNNFDAYLEEVAGQKGSIYRVRVGKLPLKQAESLKKRLAKKQLKGLGESKIIKITLK